MAETYGADVIVLGGGIIGCSTALQLALRGRSVILIERDQAGARASGVNFGGVRQNGRDLRELPLSMRSSEMWFRLTELIGIDGEFRPTGNLRLATDDTIAIQEQYYLDAINAGLKLQHLNRQQLRTRYPWLSANLRFGLFCDRDGHANPRLVSPAFAFAAGAAGATIIEGTEIVEAACVNGDFILGSRDGRIFSGACLVNAAGVWGATIAGWFGETVELFPEVPQVLVTEPAPYRIEPVVGVVGGDLYLRQTMRGNILFGGGEGRASEDILRSRPLPRVSGGAAARAINIVPALRHLQIIRSWTGVDGDTIDGVAVVGPSAVQQGLFHAFGFCGHGFQMGPGVGAVLSELICDGRTSTDISGLAIDRFQPASPIAVEQPLSDAGSGLRTASSSPTSDY